MWFQGQFWSVVEMGDLLVGWERFLEEVQYKGEQAVHLRGSFGYLSPQALFSKRASAQ